MRLACELAPELGTESLCHVWETWKDDLLEKTADSAERGRLAGTRYIDYANDHRIVRP